MSLKSRLFTAASADAGLVALLGSNPFRWYDQRLEQGSAFPAVVVESVSNPRDYVGSGQQPTSWNRLQFRVYGTGNDSQNADAVVNALADFFDTFDGPGIPGLVSYPNLIVGDRDMGIADTQPLTYMRLLDVRIFSNQDAT